MADTVSQLVIHDLAAENILLHERIASLEGDVAIYREMNQVGLATIRQLTAHLEQARRRISGLERAAQRIATATSHRVVPFTRVPATIVTTETVPVQ